MSKLWKEYIYERVGGEALEAEGGILFYSLEEDSVHILELFISKKHRAGVKTYSTLLNLLKAIAKEQGKDLITAYVSMRVINKNEILKAALYYGFKLRESDETNITLYLEV